MDSASETVSTCIRERNTVLSVMDCDIASRISEATPRWNLGRSMSQMLGDYSDVETVLDEKAVISIVTQERMVRRQVSRRLTDLHSGPGAPLLRRRSSVARHSTLSLDVTSQPLVPSNQRHERSRITLTSLPRTGPLLHHVSTLPLGLQTMLCKPSASPRLSSYSRGSKRTYSGNLSVASPMMGIREDVLDTKDLRTSGNATDHGALALFASLAAADSLLAPRPTAEQPACDVHYKTAADRRISYYSARTSSNRSLVDLNLRTVVALVLRMSGSGEIETARDSAGDTLLHIAARKGFADVVHVLLNNGANVAVTNNSGDTALHVACAMSGCKSLGAASGLHYPLEIAQLLVEAGSDVCLANSVGDTPLHLVEDTETLKYLLEQNADVTDRNMARETPLFMVTRRGNVSAAKLLLNVADNVANWANVDRQTPLHIAAENGGSSIAALLLKAGSSVDRNNADGETALHVAARTGHHAVADVLLTAKADVDALDELGRTPLITACIANRKQVVMSLIKHSANVWATWNDQTALQIAIEREHTVIVGHLLRVSRGISRDSAPSNTFNNQSSSLSITLHHVSSSSMLHTDLSAQQMRIIKCTSHDYSAHGLTLPSAVFSPTASTPLLRMPKQSDDNTPPFLRRR
eukprot:GEMP01016237.1.p1 GENE.GEMP01016237.1~~GEMP01016237.1.p1  ORF type:complete len:639 (+),score=116.43 GEMP01016237.1:273-2189(+)